MGNKAQKLSAPRSVLQFPQNREKMARGMLLSDVRQHHALAHLFAFIILVGWAAGRKYPVLNIVKTTSTVAYFFFGLILNFHCKCNMR